VSGPPIRLWAEVYFLNVQRGKPSAKSRLFARARSRNVTDVCVKMVSGWTVVALSYSVCADLLCFFLFVRATVFSFSRKNRYC
jgi:hypothetical protein